MVGNAAGGKKAGGAYKPDDFLPDKPGLRHRPRQSPEQIIGAFRQLQKRPQLPTPVAPVAPVTHQSKALS